MLVMVLLVINLMACEPSGSGSDAAVHLPNGGSENSPWFGWLKPLMVFLFLYCFYRIEGTYRHKLY